MRQRVTYGGNFNSDSDGKYIKIYSEEGSFEVVKNADGKEKHIIYIGDSPYEADVVYLKDFSETSGSYRFVHKDYLGSILAISSSSGKVLERRHYDAWGNFTHLQKGYGAIITDKVVIDRSLLLLSRGYTGHEYFPEVGIIHMNGRLYDPLLRRFLSADENIQDPFNTQNYNRYGYVLNNPLMYTDPSGEIVWMIAIGAVAGAYFTGVKANGSYNPLKWNWGATWGKIVMGGAIGAFTGGVATVIGASALAYATTSWGIQGGILGGAIAGASGGAVAGAISGFASSVMFGENILKGTFMGGLSGGVAGGVLGGVAGGIQRVVANIKAAKIGAPQGTILKGAPIAKGRSQWTLNNTPKTTALGKTPSKTGILIIDDIEFSVDEIVGFNFVDEQPIPILKEGAPTTYKGEWMKSGLKFGKDIHRGYKAEEVAQGLGYKEYRLPSGKRIDYLDIENGKIHELKPLNQTQLNNGAKQLQMYLEELQSPAAIEANPRLKDVDWKKVLEVYYKK
ncbi:RHS repeat-associated core domain-containing protein [Chryseobacterium indologenes]|uniref:RHS repeat-associated core domain-containing protein n=1 Tax=Chryseobacterium indologenes TaxID=253 RepID=UPI000787707C|nr:RHS repeat-associated core domain-containing protein [Chryseobacterium indologenes]